MIRTLAGNIRNSQRRLMVAMHMEEERIDPAASCLLSDRDDLNDDDDSDEEEAEMRLLPKQFKNNESGESNSSAHNRFSLLKKIPSKKRMSSMSKQKSIPALLGGSPSNKSSHHHRPMYDKQCSAMSQSSRYFKMPKGELSSSPVVDASVSKSIKQELRDFLKIQKKSNATGSSSNNKKSTRKLGSGKSSHNKASTTDKSERSSSSGEKTDRSSQRCGDRTTAAKPVRPRKSQSVRHLSSTALSYDCPKSPEKKRSKISSSSKGSSSKGRSSSSRNSSLSPRKSKSERHLLAGTGRLSAASVEQLKSSSKKKDLPLFAETVEETSVCSFDKDVDEVKELPLVVEIVKEETSGGASSFDKKQTTEMKGLPFVETVEETSISDSSSDQPAEKAVETATETPSWWLEMDETFAPMESGTTREQTPEPNEEPVAMEVTGNTSIVETNRDDSESDVPENDEDIDLKTRLLRIQARLSSVLDAMHQTKRRIHLIQNPEREETCDDVTPDTESVSDDEVSLW